VRKKTLKTKLNFELETAEHMALLALPKIMSKEK
jgi:hypothetical protein